MSLESQEAKRINSNLAFLRSELEEARLDAGDSCVEFCQLFMNARDRIRVYMIGFVYVYAYRLRCVLCPLDCFSPIIEPTENECVFSRRTVEKGRRKL